MGMDRSWGSAEFAGHPPPPLYLRKVNLVKKIYEHLLTKKS